MRALPSLCCLLLLASASAQAGTVYKWKDANGVTQYSEKAPTGQKYEARKVEGRDRSPARPRPPRYRRSRPTAPPRAAT